MHPFTRILKNELVSALGCTEPIAVALASAKARELLETEPLNIDAYCSGNIIKNVMGVVVPNSGGMKGIEAAVALGVIGGKPAKGLEVLSEITEKDRIKTQEMLESGLINVHLKENVPNLNIEIHMKDKQNNDVVVEILNEHSNIVRLQKNGEDYINVTHHDQEGDTELLKMLNMKSIFEYSKTVDLSEIKYELDRQIQFNEAISMAGLQENFGATIGKLLLTTNNDVRTRARAKAAAGSDARMSGCSLPVVINAGSGNQGITCSIPVLEYANEIQANEDTLMRALLVSNLTALHIKRHIGRLSAFCGVTSAGAAAGAGIAYLHDSDNPALIYSTVTNALMIDSGMICDGAKPSCAAKIASAVDAGIMGFEMAKGSRNFKNGEGLMKDTVEETIQSIGRLGAKGMKETDIEILKIMLNK